MKNYLKPSLNFYLLLKKTFTLIIIFLFSFKTYSYTFTKNAGASGTIYTITNTTTYTSDVIIEAGVHVIINGGSWRMAPGTKVLVNSKAMLTLIDGGNILPSAVQIPGFNNEWKGIEVRGDINSQQLLADQIEDPNWSFANNWNQLDFGAVIIGRGVNGIRGQISGSTYGIVLGIFQTGMPYIFNNFGGGVIRVNGGQIYDNSKMSIGFAPHRQVRHSRIIDCIFTNNVNYSFYSPAQLANLNTTFIKVLGSPASGYLNGNSMIKFQMYLCESYLNQIYLN